MESKKIYGEIDVSLEKAANGVSVLPASEEIARWQAAMNGS